MKIHPSKNCSGEKLTCEACGKPTAIELIDGKDDGTGNFEIFHCPDCYGPGWGPTAWEFVEGGDPKDSAG